MTYIEILTRINTLTTVSDIEEIVTAINALTNEEELLSSTDALFRATLTKCKEGHPKTISFSSYALRVKDRV